MLPPVLVPVLVLVLPPVLVPVLLLVLVPVLVPVPVPVLVLLPVLLLLVKQQLGVMLQLERSPGSLLPPHMRTDMSKSTDKDMGTAERSRNRTAVAGRMGRWTVGMRGRAAARLRLGMGLGLGGWRRQTPPHSCPCVAGIRAGPPLPLPVQQQLLHRLLPFLLLLGTAAPGPVPARAPALPAAPTTSEAPRPPGLPPAAAAAPTHGLPGPPAGAARGGSRPAPGQWGCACAVVAPVATAAATEFGVQVWLSVGSCASIVLTGEVVPLGRPSS